MIEYKGKHLQISADRFDEDEKLNVNQLHEKLGTLISMGFGNLPVEVTGCYGSSTQTIGSPIPTNSRGNINEDCVQLQTDLTTG